MIHLYKEKGNCCGCTACMNICPRHSISMERDARGFLYPVIDQKTCIECGACVNVCAFHKTEYEEIIPKDQLVYGLKHKQQEVREKSSSGGAFTAISDYILKQGGTVYGAAFNEYFEVIHSQAVDTKQRDKMRGSKYVQSDLGNIFTEIKSVLEAGKLVLFTGTPCQNGGLKSYLGKEYPGLILCDIACHGVPSPKVWEDYKVYLEDRYKETIQSVNFRNKDSGWRESALKVEFDKKVYKKNMQEDPFYILFFSHYILRPSCYQCVYTSFHRVSDITLADFWGIENSHKNFSDNTGVTLVLSNTGKGEKIVKAIWKDTDIMETSHTAFYQPIFETPSKASPRLQEFWQVYETQGSTTAIKKYGRLSPMQWGIKKIAVPLLKKTGLYNLIAKAYFRFR
ncbi:Coenzyme F420 hydrogenase/dehydrogenase, beta subunit C-terminal domain [Anaerocolumna sp. AGMB13025]|uniref:Coenzyme F420 hydrogenase/dehydrogenase, beta subunit C-terminal domain n=1 Tax=Anaerocolumna sp. AGMB13025 TaxID=3039116 RepID=UPI00241F90AB|nr:Coenzyme F420 hydrogenase/dehydrogenase, beta subunit C-terminal domain [Anaerocolumna sp. AGMB13025]WFR56252.1 Coenzyme F420 hydrogenase/dehydrogenase, beta subunit C-terminal domain [Anaerocolumna sp. AGMB13025]